MRHLQGLWQGYDTYGNTMDTISKKNAKKKRNKQIAHAEQKNINKHVAAIHCSNNISLLQRKIFNALLFNAYSELMTDDFHYISLTDLAKLIGYNSKDTAKLKQAFKKLQSTTVEWNIIEWGEEETNPDHHVWCSSTLLASSVIDKKRGYCRYEYSKTLSELLYQPDRYARIDLNIQNRFNSSYSLALYENCVRFKNVKTTGWIKIETFKRLMGVSESLYPKFSDFNRRVLMPALEEINALSDITVSVMQNRISQQVVELKFNIEVKEKTNADDAYTKGTYQKNEAQDANASTDSHVRTLLETQFSASKKDIHSMMHAYSSDFIESKMNLIFGMDTYQQGNVKVPLALLKSALKQDYQPSKKVSQNKVGAKPNGQMGYSINQKNEFETYRIDTALAAFSQLPSDEKERIEKRFGDFLKNHADLSYQLLSTVYAKEGIRCASAEFTAFIQMHYPALLQSVKTIDRYFSEK